MHKSVVKSKETWKTRRDVPVPVVFSLHTRRTVNCTNLKGINDLMKKLGYIPPNFSVVVRTGKTSILESMVSATRYFRKSVQFSRLRQFENYVVLADFAFGFYICDN